jgi:hypothetical protein
MGCQGRPWGNGFETISQDSNETVCFVWLNKFKRDFGLVCYSKTIVPAFAGMEVVYCILEPLQLFGRPYDRGAVRAHIRIVLYVP